MKRLLLTLLFVSLLGSVVLAGDLVSPATQPSFQSSPVVLDDAPVAPASPFHFTGGLDVQAKYFFRGYLLQDAGFIGQPYAQVSYDIYSKNDLTITPYLGTWNNVVSHGTGTGIDHWAETDINAGINSVYKNLTVNLGYTYYQYPDQQFLETHELGLSVAYDDSALELPYNKVFDGIEPHVGYYHEVKVVENRGLQDYIEVGIEPTFKPVNFVNVPVTFSVPVVVGLTSTGFYQDSDGHTTPFGFFEAGLKANIPINDHWSIVGEVDYLNLAASSVRGTDGGKNSDVTARIGVAFKY